MRLKKTYPYAYLGALVLMPVYLFIVVSHLFFVPKFQEVPKPGTSTLQKDTLFLYYLVRNDRSTFNENKTVKTFPKNRSVFLTSMLINTTPSRITAKYHSYPFQFLPDYHYSYLSNQILRI